VHTRATRCDVVGGSRRDDGALDGRRRSRRRQSVHPFACLVARTRKGHCRSRPTSAQRSRRDRSGPGPLLLRCLRGRFVSPRRSRQVRVRCLPVAAACCSLEFSLVGPPLVRSALAALRGLRAPVVSARRFARSSKFRQVQAAGRRCAPLQRGQREAHSASGLRLAQRSRAPPSQEVVQKRSRRDPKNDRRRT
jgi:hypothetical protein